MPITVVLRAAGPPTGTFLPTAFMRVGKVLMFATDERLVRFNLTGEHRRVLVLHGFANPVQHEPRRFCVTPSAPPDSCDEAPFFVFASSHMAGSHLVNGIGQSSKIVPTLAVKSRPHSLQRNVRRFGNTRTDAEPNP